MSEDNQSDWLKLSQEDFSLGINLVDDPADLDDKEIADARNVRLTSRKIVQQRPGFLQYNETAVGAATHIRSLFQFRDYSGALIPLAQCSDNKLYKGSTSFPTAGAFSSILSETASSIPAFMDSMWGVMIYVNGVDVPQVWEGTYARCQGFRVTKDNGANYYNFDSEVADEDTATVATLSAFDDVAALDWILVKSRVPKLTGFKVVMGSSVNSAAALAAIHYWDGSAWQAVSALDDKTIASAGKSFGQSGDITFTEATTVAQLVDNTYGYWWRISVSDALTTTVTIKALYLYYNIQTLSSFWEGKFFKPDGVASTVDTSVTMKDWTIYVTDKALSTIMSVGAMTVTTGAVYVKSFRKFRSIYVTMSVTNINTNAVTMTAEYWNGAAWTALTITDGTSANSKTLAQSGMITFAVPTAWQKVKVGQDQEQMWTVRLLFSAALSATVEVPEIDLVEYQDVLRPMKGVIYHKNRAFMWGRADSLNYLYYSAEFKPDVWTGSDAGYIGVPSGKPITGCARFYNELMVATADEIYLLEGYTPASFGLLKISTGGVGVSAPHSIVTVAKMVYFFHSTGFYRFDGIGVVLLSKSVKHLFDDTKTIYYIPSARFDYIQGRFNRVWNTVEWTISMGSSQTTNNIVMIFDADHEGWWMDNIVACAFLKTETLSYQDLYYHGDYTGRVHRDYVGTNDNGAAISAYVTTGVRSAPELKGWLCMYRGLRAKFAVQAAGVLSVSYALSGATSFTALTTMSMVGAGKSAIYQTYFTPLQGVGIQLKFSNAVMDVSFSLTGYDLFAIPVRGIGLYY